MTVNWYGEGCFRIQASDFNLISDPFSSATGLTPPRIKADITLFTKQDLPLTSTNDDPGVIIGQGEYEMRGVRVNGFALDQETTDATIRSVYTIDIENVRFALLGELTAIPDPSLLDKLGDVDVLFLPAGGKPFLNQKDAATLIKQIEPKVIIPTFFKIPKLKIARADIRAFAEELGQKPDIHEKFTFKKKDIESLITKLVVLGV
ncbi:MAG: hypothetical protein A3H06_00805 [Candidatus Colwellbacteria bacterium RIFCSPLOWO2_12_FULL_44_13]|uniref:Zn-dependent hydrolase n=1 Tax=Candidatus Colwellbacteria bacterium RIFCSPLOWO2_12_FULL_44_13 TaxID=1797694 RepID=A0A1G1Z9S0_9BACT|nr:MAG: hypothetical protein A3H06_00805 [Candidatus Colwellbacteria bacterium RIFCSPLOWO2_12_FULL_44_13]